MASPHYFQFIAAVWEQLPEKDRGEFAELWTGYEQVLAAVYQRQMEVNLNIGVSDLQAYSTERWLPYKFKEANFIERAATTSSSQDLSVGINLSVKNLLRFSIDGGAPVEVNIAGSVPKSTSITEIIEKINAVVGYKLARGIYENSILQLVSPTKGANSSIEILPTSNPSLNACEFVLGVDPDLLPVSYPVFKYPFTVGYDRVASVPELRDHVRNENVSVLLIEGEDYIVESGGVISFKELPPENMWAERTQVDEENPWYNYGFLTEIYQNNSPRYVNVIQGLWFSLWNGPKPSNVRIALNLLFGLPTAPESGVITSIVDDVITMAGVSGKTYTFSIPKGLEADVTTGDSVYKFQPLVTGINVYDKINYPGFIEKEIGREGIQRFLTEDATRGYGDTDETKALTMLNEYTFLPQIDVEAFIYPDINLRNVKLFLDAFRPLNKTYLFQVIIGAFRDLLGVTDRLSEHIRIDLTSNLDSNETTFMDSVTLDNYETINNDPLNLDPHGILFEDAVEIEVRESGTLIDSFTA